MDGLWSQMTGALKVCVYFLYYHLEWTILTAQESNDSSVGSACHSLTKSVARSQLPWFNQYKAVGKCDLLKVNKVKMYGDRARS